MTPLAQQTAIARLAGYTVIQINNGVPAGQLHGQGMFTPLPDYLNDLNAMHEAEATLNSNDRVRYYWMLAEVVNPMQLANQIAFPLIHATATQRAEALLRTLGKWDDSA